MLLTKKKKKKVGLLSLLCRGTYPWHLCVQDVCGRCIQCLPGGDSLFTVYIAYKIANGTSECWNLGGRSLALECPGCTWTSWSLPAPASPLRASVSPPPGSCCLLRRPSDSSDYEHKSSTCQELLLPGLCNVPAFIWRWCAPEIAANGLHSF